jgi:DNA-binding GntR family transcriptional regulator
MRTARAIERLHHAQACVRQALEQWNPADFARLDECRELLEQAVAGMRDFEGALRGRTVSAASETRSMLLALRQDIRQATRVVDAGAAFHRGLATRLGNASPGYDAGGRPFAETPPMEGELHG